MQYGTYILLGMPNLTVGNHWSFGRAVYLGTLLAVSILLTILTSEGQRGLNVTVKNG